MFFLKSMRIKTLLFLIILSLLSSHYSEQYLVPSLTSLKHLVLFSNVGRFDENEDQIYTKYSFLDKPVINPVHVAQQAFTNSEKYLFEKYFPSEVQYLYDPKTIVDTDKIITIADRFINNYPSEIINGLSIVRLPYNFDYPSYDLNKPWHSGMAQGLAVVVLLAAYDITLNDKYLVMAEKVGLTLSVTISKGGTLINVSNKGIWHEEYADSTKELHPKVLNGNNFAIDGIFWLKEMTGEAFWSEFLSKSLKGLNDKIYMYDGFFWSKYGLMGNYANWKYHSLHIVQLNKIANVYSENPNVDISNIVEYSTIFENYKYLPLGFTERLLFHSNNMLFAVLFINLFFYVMLFALIRSRIR